ncbi:MAG: helix-turn-helix domain-containing protein [Chromatiaceae bacterium]|nr:helix-turn-helix domain-containing protein [Chromatiaceae bacterium]
MVRCPVAGTLTPHAMSTSQPGDPPSDLHTAEEIAVFLKVDPKTVFNWAKSGTIPEAFRVGRIVRYSMDAVKASLGLSTGGEGREVELVVMALSLVFGPSFPRIPQVDLGSITVDELAELKRLCAAYAADLDELETPQEQAAYCEGVLEAARIVVRMGDLTSQ